MCTRVHDISTKVSTEEAFRGQMRFGRCRVRVFDYVSDNCQSVLFVSLHSEVLLKWFILFLFVLACIGLPAEACEKLAVSLKKLVKSRCSIERSRRPTSIHNSSPFIKRDTLNTTNPFIYRYTNNSKGSWSLFRLAMWLCAGTFYTW